MPALAPNMHRALIVGLGAGKMVDVLRVVEEITETSGLEQKIVLHFRIPNLLKAHQLTRSFTKFSPSENLWAGRDLHP